MSTVLIAKFKNKREASTVARLIEKYAGKVNVIKKSHLEDFLLAELIDEGMKETVEVPLEKIKKKLSK